MARKVELTLPLKFTSKILTAEELVEAATWFQDNLKMFASLYEDDTSSEEGALVLEFAVDDLD